MLGIKLYTFGLDWLSFFCSLATPVKVFRTKQLRAWQIPADIASLKSSGYTKLDIAYSNNIH